MNAWTFYSTLPKATGFGRLLELNTLYVIIQHQGFDSEVYLHDSPLDAVQEIHRAGHDRQSCRIREIVLADTHSRPVSKPVRAHYRSVLGRHGPRRPLTERDTQTARDA